MTRTAYADSIAYRTLDGSMIRELMHPHVHGNRAQSLAEATIPKGGRSLLHRHRASEELYHITSGAGWIWLADCWSRVEPGDTVCIQPGTPHCAQADDGEPLIILCCSSPAYDHDDTDLLDDPVPSIVSMPPPKRKP
jgi:mannose-6-phosphate isomerase-like protein (cupin superfamily)